jgi:hypothetical protein
VKIVATKKGKDNKFFPAFSFVAVVGSRTRDPDLNPGFGMDKN